MGALFAQEDSRLPLLASNTLSHELLLLGIAFVLTSLVGFERQLRQKSAGLRTHTLVGVGAALFMLVSKYGFTDIIGTYIVVDPSRVAAQIVSGIGFIGGGLIFVRRDVVRGLTTAASVWVAAAIGAACGAGMVIVAAATVVGHLVISYGYTALIRRLGHEESGAIGLQIVYAGGAGVLRNALVECTRRGFAVSEVRIEQGRDAVQSLLEGERGAGTSRRTGHGRGTEEPEEEGLAAAAEAVGVYLRLQGEGDVHDLTSRLAQVPGMLAVRSDLTGAEG